MASLLISFSFCYCLTFLAIILNGYVEALQEYRVGDILGWQKPDANHSEIYTQWTARKIFQVGDSLSFEYKNDSLLVVNKWGYYHCDTNKPFSAFTNGSTVIKLDRPGSFYFISGTPNHCINGQRLLVNVMSPHGHAHAHAVSAPVPAPAAQVPAFSPSTAASPHGDNIWAAPAPALESSSGDFVCVAFGSVLVALMVSFFSLF